MPPEALLTASSVTDGARINITVSPSFFTGTAVASEVIDTAVRFRDQEETEIIQEIEPTNINAKRPCKPCCVAPTRMATKSFCAMW
ncbi:MAG: hypothetical protein R3D55_20300 [Chloroflexota bacterium]